MREMGLVGNRRGKTWTVTTDSDHGFDRPADLVERQFAALEPTVQPAPAAPQKPSRKPAFPEKTIWNPGAYAKIVINACRKIKLPAMGKIRMPALKPIPAPAVKWIAVAAAAAVCAVILSALVQKVSSSRPALKASPACRWRTTSATCASN